MRVSITALTIALLSPQLGVLASPSPNPATLEDLTDLTIRLGNGEPVPENVQIINDDSPAPKLAARQNYCGFSNVKGSCCCNYCYGWMCTMTCGVSPLCRKRG